MTRRKKIRPLVFSLAGAVLALLPWILRADVTGADPGLTGAPGESDCTSCHTGTGLNAGGGSVKIVLPGSATYTPGVKQHIVVQVSDAAQRRWGFELSARATTNNAQAGSLTSTDSNTRVECANGRSAPCTSDSIVQNITHTQSGTRLGTTGGVSFEFDGTPPSTDAGGITLYAAGNAANGNNLNTGDHIYTTKVDLAAASAVSTATPSISADSGVVNGASYQPGIAANTWITIRGSNLSTTTREWTTADMPGGALPTSLDGVSVMVNNRPAYVRYVSQGQINALTPTDPSEGPVQVTVTVNGQTSNAASATLSAYSPALFTFDGTYVAATHADNSFLGKTGLFASAPNLTTPAKPGETVILHGTGFGSTSPAVTHGTLIDRLASISAPLSVAIRRRLRQSLVRRADSRVRRSLSVQRGGSGGPRKWRPAGSRTGERRYGSRHDDHGAAIGGVAIPGVTRLRCCHGSSTLFLGRRWGCRRFSE